MYSKGDVVTVREEWEDKARNVTILRVLGSTEYMTIDGETIYESSIRGMVKHLDAEALYNTRRDRAVKILPPEFRTFACSLAWEQGHSAGYDEVIGILSDIVPRLHDAVVQFRTRVVPRS